MSPAKVRLVDPTGRFAEYRVPPGTMRIEIPVALPSISQGAPEYLPNPKPGAGVLLYTFERHSPTSGEYILANVEWPGRPQREEA